VAIVGLCSCCAAVAAAEDAPFAEYRVLATPGLIEITTGYMERSTDLEARWAALARAGIVVLEADSTRTFTRRETLGSRRVETTISIAPPVGHGAGGASSRAVVRVVMDRDTLVDGPLFNGPIGLDRLTIDPARRFVTLIGSDGLLRFDGFESRRVVDEEWLNERAESVRELLCGMPGRSR
jgi:hypothetical protein